MKENIRFVFFGSDSFSLPVLNALKESGLSPVLVVTTPNRPKGRSLVVSGSAVRQWAEAHSIPVSTPERLTSADFLDELAEIAAPVYLVAAYGKIIPRAVLSLPASGALNVHPSLLPKFRGASPIQSVILSDDTETGVTIILLDEKMDHGQIIAQERVPVSPWPPNRNFLEMTLGKAGGKLAALVVPKWVRGEISGVPQDEKLATYCRKISKDDGLLDLAGDSAFENYKKIQAYAGWPGAYFFVSRAGRKIRVIVKDAELRGSGLELRRVIPEGKREMRYEDFLRGFRQSPKAS